MKNTRNRVKIASTLTGIAALAAAIFSPSVVMAAAGGIQNCTVGATCTVGEFLYDDTNAPISGATCTITSSYPNLTSFASSVALSGGGSDGWYYYSFTSPDTLGMYPTTISCTVSGDTLSIDKSFQVNDAATSTASVDTASIAEAVWGYSSRTVSSFGTLIADVWANATRTLTGGGLSSGNLATQDDVTSVRNKIDNLSTTTGDLTSVKNTVNETRLLLEKIVNKPVIENVLQDTDVKPLSDKLTGTRSMANQIYVNNQFLTQQSAALASSWNNTSGKDLLNSVIALSSVIGSNSDSSSANSMFGTVNFINDSWNWEESTNIYNQLIATDKLISDLKLGLSDYQKTPALYATAKQLIKNSIALEKTVGVVTDTGVKPTLFGKIKATNDLAVSLDEKGVKVGKVLSEYTKTGDTTGTIAQIYDLQNQIIALNKVSGAQNALVKVNQNDTNSIKNALLGLRGIVDSNKMLLSLGAGKTLLNTWLELGSIIFKTLVTNPSNLISQTVELKYYLPQCRLFGTENSLEDGSKAVTSILFLFSLQFLDLANINPTS